MLVMGSSAAFIGVSITAVAKGGPGDARDSRRLRGDFPAPAVRPAGVVPAIPDSGDFRHRHHAGRRSRSCRSCSGCWTMCRTAARPMRRRWCALVTILAILGISMKGTAMLRLWAPIIGVGRRHRDCGFLRPLRSRPHCGGTLDRAAGRRNTGLRSGIRAGLLGTAPRIPPDRRDRLDPGDQQQSGPAARLLAPAPTGRFPGGAGHGRRRGREQPAVRRCRHRPERDLFALCAADRDHRGRGADRGDRYGGDLPGAGVPCPRRWRSSWRYRARSSPPTSWSWSRCCSWSASG